MEDRQLSEKESLELISRMIRNTQTRLVKKSGIPFLVFGYLTVIVAIAVWFALERTGNYQWHFLWYAILVIGYPIMAIFNKKYPREVYTYVDRVISYIWITCGVVGAGATTLSFVIRMPIFFIILLVMGMGTALTGLVIRFKYVIISGYFAIILAFGSFFIPADTMQMLYSGIAFVLMMIIPGHIMNYKAGKQCLEN